MKAEGVAKEAGFHSAYITTLVWKYRNGGLEAISGNHYGGNRRNMSVEKEAEQIWKELRKSFRNQVFTTLEKVIDRLCDAISLLSNPTIR